MASTASAATSSRALVVIGTDPELSRSVANDFAGRAGRRLRFTVNAAHVAVGDASAAERSSPVNLDGAETDLRHNDVVVAAPTDLASVEVRRNVRNASDIAWIRDPLPAVGQRGADDLAVVTTAADVLITVGGAGPVHASVAVDELRAAVDALPTGRDPLLVDMEMTFGDGRRSDIVVGRGASGRLGDFVGDAQRVAVVTQPGVGVTVESGVEQRVFEVPDGEAAKRMDVVADVASRFAQWGMTRSDLVVAVGGGVVTDLGGFVAASYHRGIPVIHVATTLLGQVDAAIGGKCGVNLPEGKNLVGAFWQPRAVLCEIDALDTLPIREFTSGMGELAKYHFLGGGHLDRQPLTERVVQAAGIKADVVTGDEREGGRRAILNYGHTLAHALETAGGYDLRHGEAVGIGLIYAAELARRLGRIDDARVAEHRRVVTGYGLADSIPSGYDLDHLVDLFSRDKKAVTGLTFVLDGSNGVEPVQIEDRELLRETLDAVCE